MELNKNILEHHDFELIPLPALVYLKDIYGLDSNITRQVYRDPLDSTKYRVELFPKAAKPSYKVITYNHPPKSGKWGGEKKNMFS